MRLFALPQTKALLPARHHAHREFPVNYFAAAKSLLDEVVVRFTVLNYKKTNSLGI